MKGINMGNNLAHTHTKKDNEKLVILFIFA
jgi:hypothetical protein